LVFLQPSQRNLRYDRARNRGKVLSGEDIAIVGIGCRYPQAKNPAALWKLLIESKDAIRPYAESRFPELDRFYARSRENLEEVAVHLGGFLPEVDQFDPAFFEMAPREAMYLDPQYRLLMEVTWEALEDAGQTRDQFAGSRTGVYVGVWNTEFEHYLYKTSSEIEFYVMTGGSHAMASGRLSYTFGLEGPSLTVDTACSSSLVAVHLACRGLQSQECNMAIAGGVNLIFDTEASKLFMTANMLANDGHCKFGDSSADGFVRSEGAGVLVLKRLSDAVLNGDRIYATIRGSAVNSDGHSNGLMMTPSIEGQQAMLREAWRAAGIEPSRLRYIEAHGTGTSVGDPVEIQAIGKSLAAAGVTAPCLLGSIKTNVGHTESAAGVAGIIKVALGLHHRCMPASLHFQSPNPAIPWDCLPVKIASESLDLSAEVEPVLAGVNSFGLSGTNAHVVMQEFRLEVAANEQPAGPHLFLTTAHSPEALRARLSAVMEATHSGATLYELCRTAAMRRTHLNFRSAIVAGDLADLRAKLAATAADEVMEGTVSGRSQHGQNRVVFIAPGQGSQWPGMARELYASAPVFRAQFDRCSAAIASETGWSLVDRVLGQTVEESLAEIDVVQPALFAMSVSLASLWQSWGVVPQAIVGHSMGEAAAAYIAGALSLGDAAAVICRRSRLMKTIRGSGAMATVELTADVIEKRLARKSSNISIAASNSPTMTVIAGDADAIAGLLLELEKEEIFCRRVNVDVASHSSQVDPILDELRMQLTGLTPRAVVTPLYSTVRSKHLDGAEMDAHYWVDNLRQPVQFSQAIAKLAREGYDVFIELSPHPILLPSTEATLRADEVKATSVPTLRRQNPERAAMLESLGKLFCAGYPVDWSRLFPAPALHVDLPVYPFQRERCWPSAESLSRQRQLPQDVREFPFLGRQFTSSQQPSTVLWEVDLDLNRLSYLKDHKVRGAVVLPATAHLEIALEAARSLAPNNTFTIRDLNLEAVIPLSEDQPSEFQIALNLQGETVFDFEIRGRQLGTLGEWTLYSRGQLETRANKMAEPAIVEVKDFQGIGERSTAEQHYSAMARTGIEYGPAFQLFADAWTSKGKTLVRVISAKFAGAASQGYVLHPAVLDACLQSVSQVGPLADHENGGATYLPVGIERLTILGSLAGHDELYVLTEETRRDEAAGRFWLDLQITDEQGKTLVQLDGLQAQRVQSTRSQDISELLFAVGWRKSEGKPPTLPTAMNQHLLVLANRSAVSEELRSLIVEQGGRCTLVYSASRYAAIEPGCVFEVSPYIREDIDRVFADLTVDPPTAIVHMWTLDSVTADQPGFNGESLMQEQVRGAYYLPLLVQAITRLNLSTPPRLWMVTRGAVAVDGSTAPEIAAAPMWGAGTAIAREHPELRPCLIDLPARIESSDVTHLAAVILAGDEREERIAVRDDARYVPRLTRFKAQPISTPARLLEPGEEYRIKSLEAGLIDSLGLYAFARRQPGAGEVAIEVEAAGLNFIDVAKALGIYPGLDPTAPVMLGGECAGRIVAIGVSVTRFAVGDAVVGINSDFVTNGLMASYAVLPEQSVIAKAANVSFEQAASMPLAYVTAYHSLIKLAHVAKGDWVLIHAGAGGVGLAAIEVAQRAGARVIATASSPEKHGFLHSLGVEHVLQSRTTDFARQTMEITGGRGVDIVLNSLAGEFMIKSLETLAPGGRFIELGKRDVYQDRRIGLLSFRDNISYHVVDLLAVAMQQPEYTAFLLSEVMARIASGEWKPLPVTVFPSSEAAAAFRFVAQARQIGRVVFSFSREVEVFPATKPDLFRADATYILTGGLGGVGSAAALWMAANGARNLVLISRREPSNETIALVREIERYGASVMHARTDIADGAQVDALMATVHASMPPLKGVLHAAASIDDALALDLTPERFGIAMNAKVLGAWNLHQSTLEDSLDFFILFSSLAGVYPQVGVVSYAAANVFLDSFAQFRQAQGRRATAVAWGAWDKTGLAREAGTSLSIDSYKVQGLLNFTQQEGLECLRAAITQQPAQIGVFRFDEEAFRTFHADSDVPFIFADLSNGRTSETQPLAARHEILEGIAVASTFQRRRDLMESYLQEQLSKVLKLSADRIDRERPLGAMGLDSLMALEFVRRVNSGLATALPATAAFNYPTIRQLSAHLLEKLHFDASEPQSTVSTAEMEPALRLDASIEELSEEEALRSLMEGDGVARDR
jgi:acyl transferase domain-containing protein/NADPH:quinone reductase-like Zn-dependent oxidoreductase/acyl carrier protein